MKNILKSFSKLLYGLTFISLFLPAFVVPSCSSEKSSAGMDTTKVEDSLEAVLSPDTIFSKDSAVIESRDSTAKDTVAVRSESLSMGEVDDEEKSRLLLPDGENFSFWGYLCYTIPAGFIWVFLLLISYSGVLRILFGNNLTIALQSSVALVCLSLYLLFDVWGYIFLCDDVVWGFWLTFGLAFIGGITNWLIYFRDKKSKEVKRENGN